MKGFLLLADSAKVHADGSVSMLCAGHDAAYGPELPVAFSCAVVIQFMAERGDEGKHTFDVRCVDEDGRNVLPRLAGEMTIARAPATRRLDPVVHARFDRVGLVVWELWVDGNRLFEWPMIVSVKPPTAPGESRR